MKPAYALWKLQDRGRMFVSPGDPLYEGMVIGIHSRDNDLVVNPIKGKQLTNVRASGTDEAVRLVTPIAMNLEYAVEFIDDSVRKLASASWRTCICLRTDHRLQITNTHNPNITPINILKVRLVGGG